MGQTRALDRVVLLDPPKRLAHKRKFTWLQSASPPLGVAQIGSAPLS